MKKLKVKKFLIATNIAFIASTLPISFTAHSDNVDMSTTIAQSIATEQVLGHAPGIETFLLARNHPNYNSEGFGTRLQMCDALKVSYRILDIDGDTADLESIKKSIRWFIQVSEDGSVPDPNDETNTRYYLVAPGSNAEKNREFSEIFQDTDSAPINSGIATSPLPSEMQNLSLILYDEIMLRKGDFEQGELQTDTTLNAFVKTQRAAGFAVYIGYEIQAFTSTGTPFSGHKILYNNQSKETLILPPNPVAGNTTAQVEDNGKIKQEYISVVDKYTVMDSFQLHPTAGQDCEVPPGVENDPYVIGYYEIIRDSSRQVTSSHLVDYLVAGKEYKVKFYLDKNQNGRIDTLGDEDITEVLLDETKGKDYLNRPFVNGLRLDMSLENYNADQSDIPSVFSSETVIGAGFNEVKLKGIGLDQFIDSRKNLDLDSNKRFFFIDNLTNPASKYLIFRTFEGLSIPEEVLDSAPQLLGYYKDASNAVTLQRFILNVRSKLPAGYPTDLVGEDGGIE